MVKRGTILVLNQDVSGMNRFLFEQLEKEWYLIVEDVPEPKAPKYIRMGLTFHPSILKWKTRLYASLLRYSISKRCFEKRSKYARRIVDRNRGKFDAALQIGGLFNSFQINADFHRIVFASFNTYLAYTQWRPWAPFESDEEFSRFYALERELYHNADCLLCTNKYVINSFMKNYELEADKLHYIGYGINFDVLPDIEKRDDLKIALFIGYEFERKGGPAVIEAFKAIREEIPDARLRIIGPLDLDKKYLVNGVEYLGRISDRNEIERHMSEASFFVMPSLCEPFGLVFLEAMAYKNACIGSTNNAMPEIIEHGKTGYLVSPGEVDELSMYMKNLFVDATLRRKMGIASFQRVQRHFTWDVCGERVRKILSSLSTDKSKACI